MTKRIAAAVLMCAVMVLVALVPLASGGEWTIIKGPQGPRASAKTWTYEPTEYGMWSAKIDNYGLRSVVLDVCDNTTGVPEDLLHQRIRFAAYDVYPNGVMYSNSVSMKAGSKYEVTVTPNGPRDSKAIITDQWLPNLPPVAKFVPTPNYLDVTVNASESYDPDGGWITDYVWNWGDGSPDQYETTPYAMHSYAMAGDYEITLIVADNVGMTGDTSQWVTVTDHLPVAMFTYIIDGMTVYVDASDSSDDFGIVSYDWNWGDGTTGTGKITSHTYSATKAMNLADASADVRARPPGTPYYSVGYAIGPGGIKLPGCTVTIKNLNTGSFNMTTSDADGFYMFDVANEMDGSVYKGQVINVTAELGTMIGWGEGTANTDESYLWMDIMLHETVPQPIIVTITLTVADTIGQTATVSQQVTLYP